MLCIHESNLAAPLLGFCQNVQGQRGLAGGFGTINLNDSSLGDAANAQCGIQRQRARGDCFHIHLRAVAKAHDSTLAEILVNLCKDSIQCFFLIRCGSRGFIGGLFCCHFNLPSCRTVPVRLFLCHYSL